MDSSKATTVVVVWVGVFGVLYFGFGGRWPFYRSPTRMIIAGLLAFIVAMMLAFALISSTP